MGDHRFGGTWTELKLDAIAAYLAYYNTRLQNQPSADRPFRRWYVDAFAGSGSRTTTVSRGGLFDGTPAISEEMRLAGSARRALEIEPMFDKLIFVEPHRGRFSDLSKLVEEFPDRNIDSRRGDANTQLNHIFNQPPWRCGGRANFTDRAVVFLDPYGMNVNWATLTTLAQTSAADVWYLFPLEAVNRQLAHDIERIDASKQARLDQIFGTSDWRTDLYRTIVQRDLFSPPVAKGARSTDRAQIEAYAIARLKTIYSYVSPPLPLVKDSSRHLYSLLCLANPATQKATAAIQTGVNWVLKRYGPASHRTPDH